MLHILLVAVGTRMPQWVTQGYEDYAKRIRPPVKLELREIPAHKRGKNVDLSRVIQEEEARIDLAVSGADRVVALDRCGKSVSTRDLSNAMTQWMQHCPRVAIVIGGPEGLSQEFLDRAHNTWSMSAMTFAHPVARVMVAEQVYRSYSILQGSPYHR